MKYVLYQQQRNQNKVIDIPLVSLSLTLNIFHNFFLLFLFLILNRPILAGNDISNCYIFLLIIVTHNMDITHIIHRKKNKKTLWKMFSGTNFMEQDYSKNHLALVKTNRVSKYVIFVQKLCCSNYEYKKARVRNIVPSLY